MSITSIIAHYKNIYIYIYLIINLEDYGRKYGGPLMVVMLIMILMT